MSNRVSLLESNSYFKLVKNSSDGERGVALVEFAIVGSVFLLFILLAMESLFMVFQALTLQYITSLAMRTSSVGPVSDTTGDFDLARATNFITNTKATIRNLGADFGITLNNENIRICPLTNPDCTEEALLDPGELYTVSVTHPFTLFIKSLTVNLSGLAIGKMQDYPNR